MFEGILGNSKIVVLDGKGLQENIFLDLKVLGFRGSFEGNWPFFFPLADQNGHEIRNFRAEHFREEPVSGNNYLLGSEPEARKN